MQYLTIIRINHDNSNRKYKKFYKSKKILLLNKLNAFKKWTFYLIFNNCFREVKLKKKIKKNKKKIIYYKKVKIVK